MMYKEGSLWNKWDLHIHTDASDGKGSCQQVLDAAVAKHIKCIAVTDHHTVANIDEMKRLATTMEVSVISGVEFRTEYGSSSVHMIGLFPDEFEGTKLDSAYLNENVLNPLGISHSKIIQKGREVLKKEGLSDDEYFKNGMFQVQVDFKQAANLIHKYGGLVTVHAGSKSNSIDVEMKHEGSAAKNVSIEDSLGPVKEELFKGGFIDICDLTKPKESTFYQKKFGIPSITTSDAHGVDEVGKNACWIKTDLTFNGLRQIIAEPERISFEEPDILKRIKKNPDKFIKGLEIRRTTNASMPEIWFDNLQIPLNPGLVAVIGNKGSGKSALTDIVALCANTTNQNWSFLTSSKYRMSKPYNRSKQTEACLMWFDNSRSAVKTLDMPSDTTQPERVKYIPQNFLETLCTTEDDHQFEDELKKIIFQYLEPEQRFGLNDLDSIINYLTKENTASCSEIQSRIKSVNTAIIELESMLVPTYKSKLENELRYKQEQLSNAQQSKPKEVTKPSLEDNPNAKQAKEEIEKIQAICKQLTTSLQELSDERNMVIKDLQDITASKERLERFYSQLESMKSEIKPLYEQNKLDIDSVLSVSYHPEIIVSKIFELNERLTAINKQLDANNSDGLQFQYVQASQQLEEANQKLSAPELEYQKYLKDKQDWEKMLEEITGTSEKEGTIEYLKSRIYYINHQLKSDLKFKIELRRQYVEELMQKKHQVLETYNNLFAPIVKIHSRLP